MSTLSLAFATIDRAYAAERLILSVRRHLPDLPIHVAEQADAETPFADFCAKLGVRHLRLPHDSGVAAARNALVAAIDTEYFVLCDDDFILTEATDFAPAMHILHHNLDIGIVGGRLWDITEHGRAARHWEVFLNLDRHHRTLTAVPASNLAPLVDHCGPYRFFRCDAVLNFAVMRRSIFARNIRWDPAFRCNGEHEDFYLNLKHHSDIGVAYFPGMVADHHHVTTPAYAGLRDRAEGWQAFMDKWGIDQYLGLDLDLQLRSQPGIHHPNSAVRQRYLHDLGAPGPGPSDANQMILDANGRLVPSAPFGDTDTSGPRTAMLAVFGRGLVTSVSPPVSPAKPCPDSAVASPEGLLVFAACAPQIGCDADHTLWLRAERRTTRRPPGNGLRLPLILRWRVGRRYLNWSAPVTELTLPPDTVPDWVAVQATPPFALRDNSFAVLELWSAETGGTLLASCNCHLSRNAVGRHAPMLGRTPAIDASLANGYQITCDMGHIAAAGAGGFSRIDLSGLEGATICAPDDTLGPIAVPTQIPAAFGGLALAPPDPRQKTAPTAIIHPASPAPDDTDTKVRAAGLG